MEIEPSLLSPDLEKPYQYHGDWRDVTDSLWGPDDGPGPYDGRRRSSVGSFHRPDRQGGWIPVVNYSAQGTLY